ncbi:MAG: 4-hydroxythreonine-4-phosphate dehydrogenase PdxA [Pseudomonadota bacterium]
MDAPLALTMGDPAGVGPEITLKAWSALRESGPPFVWIGPAEPLRAAGAVTIAAVDAPADAAAAFAEAIPVWTPPGASAESPNGVAEMIAAAVDLTLQGEASAVVTNPIRKASLAAAGLTYPGHTEYVAALSADAALPHGFDRGPAMMMRSAALTTVLATIHLPLRAVPELITRENVLRVILLTEQSLRRDFGVERPRVLVCGLNPHAGEDGLLGAEDRAEITPAVEAARDAGVDAVGPVAGDAAFRSGALSSFDAAVAMYHDQGLIPVKTLDFHGTVNVTIGLPIVRTSPDHGVGLDIVGKGIARPDSLIAALKTADEMTRNRARFDAGPA